MAVNDKYRHEEDPADYMYGRALMSLGRWRLLLSS